MFALTPLGQIQKNPATVINQTITTFGTTAVTVYTCPTGKKATINVLSDRLVALGANTKMNVIVAGITIRSPTVADPLQVIEQITGASLSAGQTIQISGDNAGNNGTCNLFATVTELPI